MKFRYLRYLLSTQVIRGLVLLACTLIAATVGYMVIEGWNALDASYMAIISVTTVGYSEVNPLSTEGRVFTMFVVLIGVGLAFYILTVMVAAIIEGEFLQVLDRGRLRLAVQDLRDHYVVCGYGRVGEEVVRELVERKVPLVVVDPSASSVERAHKLGVLTVLGDAMSEAVLIEAGIGRCNTVFAATDSDSINTYITLTAKGLEPDVTVVARVGSPSVEAKLRQAGADRVVSPYSIGGRRMAFAALQPLVTDFVDLFSNDPLGERVLAEVAVDEESGAGGRTVGQLLVGSGEVVVLAVRETDGRLVVGPPPSRVLQPGEVIIVIGSDDDVRSIGMRPGRSTPASAAHSSMLDRLQRFLRRST